MEVIKDKLVLLDLDGVLCHRSFHLEPELDSHTMFVRKILRNKSFIYYHKDIIDFIRKCMKFYQVGIYSSITKKNIDNILEILLEENTKSEIVRIWHRGYTEPDPEPIKDWETIKSIDLIKKNLEDEPIYIDNEPINFKKILLCDDSERKTRYNDQNNILIVNNFKNIDYEDLLSLINQKFNL